MRYYNFPCMYVFDKWLCKCVVFSSLCDSQQYPWLRSLFLCNKIQNFFAPKFLCTKPDIIQLNIQHCISCGRSGLEVVVNKSSVKSAYLSICSIYVVSRASETSARDTREGMSLSRAVCIPRAQKLRKTMFVKRCLLFEIYC